MWLILSIVVSIPYNLDSIYELLSPGDTVLNGGECADKAFLYYNLTKQFGVSFVVGDVEGESVHGSHAWCTDRYGRIIECCGGFLYGRFTPTFILDPSADVFGEFAQYDAYLTETFK